MTVQFIQNLKKECSLRSSKYISNRELSTILGQKKGHIKWILEASRKDSNFILTGDFLNKYQINLVNRFRNISSINILMNAYRKLNKVKEKNYHIHNFHPNLNLNYFKNLDTKAKAYFFGLLFADGSLYREKNGNLATGIELNNKDELLLLRFANAIGFDLERLYYKEREFINEETNEIRLSKVVRLRFSNRLFGENMASNGFVIGKKSGIIRFPKLKDRELKLAFLLGFFDGDGKQGTTRISSNSLLFIQDIKREFKLAFKIEVNTYEINSGEIREYYKLGLGADLFNDMLDNYEDSLPRKRVRFQSTEERRKVAIERFSGARKFKFSKQELEDLVWKYPLKRIAEIHNERFGVVVSWQAIQDWRKKLRIKSPPKGYFLRREYIYKDE